MKLSATHNVIKALNPAILYVAVETIEGKPENVTRDLFNLVGNSASTKIQSWSLLLNNVKTQDSKGALLIVFDGCIPEKAIPNVDFSISLSKPEDREMLVAMGFQELSASSYFHYHGRKRIHTSFHCIDIDMFIHDKM